MKKHYSKPFVTTETIETELQFLTGSIVSSVKGENADIIYDGGGSVPARSRGSREFDGLIDEQSYDDEYTPTNF